MSGWIQLQNKVRPLVEAALFSLRLAVMIESVPSSPPVPETGEPTPKSSPVPEHIDLALSGGGFRAALFHLGVICFLKEHGWMSRVQNICSVSGGSVLAAYLIVHWREISGNAEEFSNRVRKFVEWIAKTDVSGRVLNGSKGRLWKFMPLDSELLIKEYNTVLWDKEKDQPYTWEDLGRSKVEGRPQLHVLARHLNTGRAGAFSVEGFNIPRAKPGDPHEKEINALIDFATKTETRGDYIARAVASSSAFPPVFSPVALKANDRSHLLTDGGVYDNSGVSYLTELYAQNNCQGTNRMVIVSDAGRAFATKINQTYESFFELGTRVIDAQSERIALEVTKKAEVFFRERGVTVARVSILDKIKSGKKPTTHTPIVEELLAQIRTELDQFTPEEAFVLCRHGYLAMQQQCLDQKDHREVTWTPADTIPSEDGGASPVHLSREELQYKLRESHIVKKWGKLAASIRRGLWIAAISAVCLCLFMLGTGFLVGWYWTSEMVTHVEEDSNDTTEVTDVANDVLAKADRKPFVENAVVKTYFHFPVEVPIAEMTTLFFECEPATKMDVGATIKVQVLIPKLTSAAEVKVRPRTAHSTGPGSQSFVYSWNQGSNPPVMRALPINLNDAGYEVFKAHVETDGAIVIVSYYAESPFAASTKEAYPPDYQTGWIHVEVSDFANKSKPNYFFAIGTNEQQQLELNAFDVVPGKNQPRLASSKESVVRNGILVFKSWPPQCINAQSAVLRFLDDTKSGDGDKFNVGIQQLLKHFDRGDNWNCIGHSRPSTDASVAHDLAYIVKRTAK